MPEDFTYSAHAYGLSHLTHLGMASFLGQPPPRPAPHTPAAVVRIRGMTFPLHARRLPRAQPPVYVPPPCRM
jgi:hypothetical protein